MLNCREVEPCTHEWAAQSKSRGKGAGPSRLFSKDPRVAESHKRDLAVKGRRARLKEDTMQAAREANALRRINALHGRSREGKAPSRREKQGRRHCSLPQGTDWRAAHCDSDYILSYRHSSLSSLALINLRPPLSSSAGPTPRSELAVPSAWEANTDTSPGKSA